MVQLSEVMACRTSQFFMLLRPHAELVASEQTVFTTFRKYCVSRWLAKTKCGPHSVHWQPVKAALIEVHRAWAAQADCDSPAS